MRRRAFLAIACGGAVARVQVSRAQRPAIPEIGLLGAPAAQPYARYAAAFRQGLSDAGYVEGHNVTIEYRWADGQYDRLPGMAAELVRRHVAAIVTVGGAPATLAAKAATSTIPIIFNMTADPVKLGLVASLSRPGGNVTGIAMLGVELEAKRLELLHEVVPTAALIGVLVNPANPQSDNQLHDVQRAARALGKRILVANASTEREIGTAFVSFAQEHVGALLIGQDAFFTSQPGLFATLTAQYAMLAISPWRTHVEAGSLMSFGTSLVDAYSQAGVYAGRILKGERPADLPVFQAAKFELVINLKAARALDITVPQSLLLRADGVIQ